MSVLVVSERDRSGNVSGLSWEALAAGRMLAGLTELPLKLLIVGADIGELATQAAGREVAQVVAIDHGALAAYTADAYCQALQQAIEATAPQYVVFPHSYQVRDYGAKLATSLGRPFLSDCTGIRNDGDEVVFARPVFQGKLVAESAFSGDGPHFLSVQSGAFSEDTATSDAPAPVEALDIQVDAAAIRVQAEPPFQEAEGGADLSTAERIVSVGRGIKDPDNIALAQKLADALGAELAASRPICDSGWMPLDRQVGSSGQTVKPRLYLALGISGAIQHLVGMKGSDIIVAVNTDPSAPIFDVADYGVVGDLFEVVPALLEALDS